MLTGIMAIFELILKLGPVVDTVLRLSKIILNKTKIRKMTEYEKIEHLYKKYGGEFDKKDVNIFGIQKGNEADDTFNDLICVAFNKEVYKFVGTTDPGKWYAKNPVNPKGTAHIMDGFHKECWIVGTHRKGKSNEQKNSLVQHGNPVRVWRDTNQNFKYDDGDTHETGYFGTNFHHAKNSKKIGKWSAGCQVIQMIPDFREFMRIVRQSPAYLANHKKKFSYKLFPEKVKLS